MGGKKKQKHDKVRPARAPKGDSIEDRPEEIDKREEPFHWEMDSVVSAKEGGSKRCAGRVLLELAKEAGVEGVELLL